MSIETERRFLVKNDDWKQHISHFGHISQGYLSDDPERIVRIRKTEFVVYVDKLNIADEVHIPEAYITVKGIKKEGSGLEFEYSISLNDADKLLNLCKYVLIKTRYIVDVPTGGWVSEFPDENGDTSGIIYQRWEIDEFHGDNEGLIIAEYEMEEIGESFFIPGWIGQEVTDDQRYANSNLAQYPYNTWDKLFV